MERGSLLGRGAVAAVVIFGAIAACGGKAHVRSLSLDGAWNVELEAAELAIGGIAIAGTARLVVAVGHRGALTVAGQEVPGTREMATTVAALTPALAWKVTLAGNAGPVAVAGDLAAVAISGTEPVTAPPLALTFTGTPGAVVVGLSLADGTPRWTQPLSASQWVLVRAIAGEADSFVVAGHFAGTLRVGQLSVTSAGNSDGFVALLEGGEVRWLHRVGGAFADAVSAVAIRRGRIAIGGTFTHLAQLRSTELTARDPDTLAPDGFVASLTSTGEVEWAHRIASATEDSVAGVAIGEAGDISAAATTTDEPWVTGSTGEVGYGGVKLDAPSPRPGGAPDGLVVLWHHDGGLDTGKVFGGAGQDGARGLVAGPGRLYLGGWLGGDLYFDDQRLVGGDSDQAFIAADLPFWRTPEVLVARGPGREDVAALAGSEQGWAAVIAHTGGLDVGGVRGPAPSKGHTGALVVFSPR